MKKVFVLFLCVLSLVMFSACGNNKSKFNDAVDLSYYAKLGQIPELKYKLFDDCKKVDNELSDAYEEFLNTDPGDSHDDDHDHFAEETFYNKSEEDGCVVIDAGNAKYLYKTDSIKDGISCIVSYGDAFTFEMGTSIFELKKAMPSIQFNETDITEDAIFFDDYLFSGTLLTTQIDDKTIAFIFQDADLYCTAIYITNSWK